MGVRGVSGVRGLKGVEGAKMAELGRSWRSVVETGSHCLKKALGFLKLADDSWNSCSTCCLLELVEEATCYRF